MENFRMSLIKNEKNQYIYHDEDISIEDDNSIIQPQPQHILNEQIAKIMLEAFETAEYPNEQIYIIEPNKYFCEKFAELLFKKYEEILKEKNKDEIEDKINHIYKLFGFNK